MAAADAEGEVMEDALGNKDKCGAYDVDTDSRRKIN